MPHYIALFHPAAEGGYWVDFPDFPGCITQGDTLEEARAMAEDALAGHVEVMLEEGDVTSTDISWLCALLRQSLVATHRHLG